MSDVRQTRKEMIVASKLEKLKEKHKLKDQDIFNICGMNHLEKYVYKNKHMVDVNVNLDDEALKIIKKISKKLKVSENSVVVGLLISKMSEKKVS